MPTKKWSEIRRDKEPEEFTPVEVEEVPAVEAEVKVEVPTAELGVRGHGGEFRKRNGKLYRS